VALRAGTGAAGQRVEVEALGRGRVSGKAGTALFFKAKAPHTEAANERRGRVSARFDYSTFAEAYGGAWSSRLRLVTVQDCEAAGASFSCGTSTPIESRNNTDTQTVTAEISMAALASETGITVALAAGPSGEGGDFTATPLSAASSWSGGGSTGSFTWSYPLRMPPVPGRAVPEIGLNYSSGSVDGRTSSVNNQTSWIGEGFALEPGYVERTYVPCVDDMKDSNATERTADLCWRDDNLTLVLGDRASKLLKTANGEWKLEDDDGSRIQRKTGANRALNGEYWILTTTDGTQYSFGRNKRFATDTAKTDSVSTVPVFGNQAGEPCREAAFKDSACQQAWRWGLDYVVDADDNSATYFYKQETNKYGKNLNKSVAQYDRAAHLTAIEYGERAGGENSAAPVKVTFGSSPRCIASGCSPLTDETAANWPDVPADQLCSSDSSCSDRFAPTFFSTIRLTSITTAVLKGGSYSPVDEWKLGHKFPSNGDGTRRSLWLETIDHTGKAGGTASEPAVTLSGEPFDNRVDRIGDGARPYAKMRVTSISNGSGGVTSVNYSTPDCSPTSKPSADKLSENTRRCFPSYFTPPGYSEPQLHFFHKYVVKEVVESDATGDAPDKVTSWDYAGDPAWAYDSNSSTPKKFRTYNDWRGYETVSERTGAPGTPRTNTEYLYMRGMTGKSVGDADAPSITDKRHLKGFIRKKKVTLGPGGATVTTELNTPWISSDRASDPDGEARLVRVAATEIHTPLASGGTQVKRSSTTYNADGFATEVHDVGVVGVADNTCTVTTYATNRTAWILNTPSRVRSTVGDCSTTPTKLTDVFTDVRTSYDGGEFGAAPTRGNETRTESIKGGTPTTPTYQTDAVSQYDEWGRVTSLTDGLGRTTATSYLRNSTDGTTTIVMKQPDDVVTTTIINAEWGAALKKTDDNALTTEAAYDPLGRMTGVWNPGRSKASGLSASIQYAYTLSATATNVVTTRELNASGAYVTSYHFYDGLFRPRSRQAPAAGTAGGRLITETVYDSAGRVYDERGPFYNTAAPSPALVQAADYETPLYTRYAYDQAGRVVAEMTKSMGAEKWRTTTTYGGDRMSFDPPDGETPTTTVFDGFGRTIELRQYKGATPSGDADVTTYGYTPAGLLESVTTAAGASWRNTYDVRGNLTTSKDPDKGTTTMTYDLIDRVTTSRNARGQTLWTRYDERDRKVELREDGASGPLRASWSYDAKMSGLLDSASRWETRTDSAGNPTTAEYRSEVLKYDSLGRPTETSLSIPAVEGALARTGGYRTLYTYNSDDSIKSVTPPSVPGLVSEKVAYNYDALGNITQVAGVGSIISGTLYSPFGEVLQRDMGPTLGKSVYLSREYEEGTRRLLRQSVSRQGSATTKDMDLRYSYDPAGRVTSVADLAGDSSRWDRQCFRYDYLSRVTEAWAAQPAGAGCTEPSISPVPSDLAGQVAPYWDSYRYSASGNRQGWVQRRGLVGTTSTVNHDYTYPSGSSAQPHAMTSIARSGAVTENESFTYDAAGNTVDRDRATAGGQTIAWDAEGRQASVTDKATGKKTSYVYDADGNRLLKRDEKSGTTTLYAGMNEYVLKNGTVTGSRHFEVGGEHVATRVAGTIKLILGDTQGTGLVQVDGTSGALVKRRFDPFGQPRIAAAGWTGDRGFLAKTTDTSTGTTHLGAREYDPHLGRFLSVDPIIDLSDPQQMQGYSYANNNPVTLSDPTGLWPSKDDNSTYAPEKEVTDRAKDGKHPSDPGTPPSTSTDTSNSTSTGSGSPKQQQWPPRASNERTKAMEIGVQNGTLAAYRPTPVASFNPARLLFDWQACAKLLSGSCGVEAAMVLPVLKPLKLAKVGLDGVKAARGGAKAANAGTKLGWSSGDDIYSLTKAGNTPAWSTVRGRFWKNEAANPQVDSWSASNLDRMKRGLAPQRYNRDKGGLESMELSHEPIPYRDGGTSVIPRWPQDHANVDPFRFPGY